LLEFTVRERLRKRQNVEIRSMVRVTEIVPSGDGSGATGVRFLDQGSVPNVLDSDLVIDSSGRGVPTLAFLRATGRPEPEETQIGVGIGYTTARYRIPRDQSRTWQAVLHLPKAPATSRGALLYPMEGDQWILAIGGRGDETPPGDEAGFLNSARLLRTSTIFDAISSAERVGDLVRYSFPKSVRRHFARLTDFPAGLVPLGDSICLFNPIYGQGMSVAAQEAVLLRRLLREGSGGGELPRRLASDFFAQVEPILETPWAMAALPDLIYPSTTGDRPGDFAQMLQFGAALTRLAAREADVHKTMIEVGNLLRPRSVYREPDLMKRVVAEMGAA
jgi:2-polyprenyl-6-methoxyphenol hydroxylase-like FAD-dependent oxidoreductase